MEHKSAGGKGSKYVEEGGNSILDDESRSSSSSYSSSSGSMKSTLSAEYSSDIADDLDTNEHDTTRDEKQPDKGLPKPGSSASLPLGYPPPIQVMEKTPDASHYRIPSHVFATNKPSTPTAEWSIASNESLFSIPNMSLTREEFNVMLKSGDLGVYGDLIKSGDLGNIKDMCKSGELPPPLKDALKSMKEQMPPIPPQMRKSEEPKALAVGTNVGAEKVNPRSEVLIKKEADPPTEELPCPASVSRHTEACAPSFAFQVVSKNDRCSSVCSTSTKSSQIDKPKEKRKEKGIEKDSSHLDREQQQQQQQPRKVEEPKAQVKPHSSSSWFSRFSCCSRP